MGGSLVHDRHRGRLHRRIQMAGSENQYYIGVRISIVNPILALRAIVHKIPENGLEPRITLT